MAPIPPPRPVSDTARDICITNHVFAWHDDLPGLVIVPGSPDLFLPVFSTAGKLTAWLTRTNVPFESIKQIDDQYEFLDSLPYYVNDVRLRIIVDPYVTDQGTMRYTEIIR